jgi:hypothetical protein
MAPLKSTIAGAGLVVVDPQTMALVLEQVQRPGLVSGLNIGEPMLAPQPF